jgi:hypothetical protein
MSVPLPKSKQLTFGDMIKFTSSPASEAGPMPSLLPDGPGPSGPAPARANRSARQESGKEQAILGISGLNFADSSPSAALQRSLANRLRARMAAFGSLEYELIWKEWVMPSGPPICALRASGRRISDKGCTGWPTPNAMPENRGGLQSNPEKALERRKQGHALNLDDAATLAGWPTPMAGSPATERYNEAGNTQNGIRTVALVAGWATPQTSDYKGQDEARQENRTGNRHRGDDLPTMAGWATPKASDGQGGRTTKTEGGGNAHLDIQARSASGPHPSGSPAQTAKRGVLNPRFSLWLMGYPVAWASCGERAMRSCRKLPRSS